MTAPSSGTVWQTRLSRDVAATYENDLRVLGIDRSEALRRGLRLLHREALEAATARDFEDFYGGKRAPLSEVTAAACADLELEAGSDADPSRVA